MRIRCQQCNATYDDTYRWTYCPHARFDMHTVMVRADGVTQVCTSVEQLESFLSHPERSQAMDQQAIHPASLQVLKYFEYAHLPPHLQEISQRFHDLAWKLAEQLPGSPEVTVGLRKMLEAKDCMVRAALP